MRIAVNTLSVDSSKGGIRIFLCGLLEELTSQLGDGSITLLTADHNESLFDRLRGLPQVSFEKIEGVTDRAIARIWADQVRIKRHLSNHDVLLTPSNIASLTVEIPQVVVVQAPLAIRSIRQLPYVPKGLVSRFHRYYYDAGIPLTMRTASRVVAVSQFLADKLVAAYPLHARKVEVVHEGVSFEVQKRHEGMRPSDFLLFVSSLFPYKNADCFIRAFAAARGISAELAETKIVICGKDPDGMQFARLRDLAQSNGLLDRLELRGQVSHEVLRELYSSCRAFVYPSSVETFGLPILEAMALGAPVICSDKMSVPEIAGDAALVVDPDNIDRFAQAICEVCLNRALAESLQKKGYARVVDFSWRRCAHEVHRVLRDAAVEYK